MSFGGPGCTSKLGHATLAPQHLLHPLLHRRDERGCARVALGHAEELPAEHSERPCQGARTSTAAGTASRCLARASTP